MLTVTQSGLNIASWWLFVKVIIYRPFICRKIMVTPFQNGMALFEHESITFMRVTLVAMHTVPIFHHCFYYWPAV